MYYFGRLNAFCRERPHRAANLPYRLPNSQLPPSRLLPTPALFLPHARIPHTHLATLRWRAEIADGSEWQCLEHRWGCPPSVAIQDQQVTHITSRFIIEYNDQIVKFKTGCLARLQIEGAEGRTVRVWLDLLKY